MFLLMGVEDRMKILPYQDDEMHVCKSCGKYCSYEIIMKYTVLTLFLIPVFKWNKSFYAKSSCCQNLFDIKKEVGDAVYKGREYVIRDEDVHYNGDTNFFKFCSFCGYESSYQYNYCPKCGHKYQL